MTAPRLPTTRPWSMTVRLILLQLLTVAVMMGGALTTLYYTISSHLDGDNREDLLNQAAVLSRWLATTPASQLGNSQAINPLATLPLLLRLCQPDGEVIYETRDPHLPSRQTFPAPQTGIVDWNAPDRQRYLLTSVWLHQPAGGDTGQLLQIAYDVSDDVTLLRHVRQRMGLVYVLTISASGIVSLLIARGVFRPVAELATAASRVQASQLTARIDEAGWPAELTALAREFDAMLARLDEAFRRLARFSSDLSHELRTPINILRGEAEVALSRPRTAEEYRRVMESSLEEYARLSRLIDTLLFIAKADNPAEGITRRTVDAATECGAVAEFFEAAAAERSLTILVRGTAQVYCDSELLRRALANLVDNAAHHTASGGHIDLTVRDVGADGTEIEVRDDGKGIAAKDLPRIFERFYRSEKSPGHSHPTSGFGLGLAIVKSIIDLHGGTVSISSDAGSGTAVILRFPHPPR